jgi:hypothetical protein
LVVNRGPEVPVTAAGSVARRLDLRYAALTLQVK